LGLINQIVFHLSFPSLPILTIINELLKNTFIYDKLTFGTKEIGGIKMILSTTIIDTIYTDTEALLQGNVIRKTDLVEEIKMFELTMSQVKQHPWQNLSFDRTQRDQSSPLYHNIQTSYVGDDPEEDYKEVIVWKLADMLYITAAVDHDPSFAVKWDVVVYNG
jgi:hypothetical protein